MPVPRRRRKDHELISSPDQMSRDAVARRAYELYLQRGGEHGNDWQDWFAAERELNSGAADVAA